MKRNTNGVKPRSHSTHFAIVTLTSPVGRLRVTADQRGVVAIDRVAAASGTGHRAARHTDARALRAQRHATLAATQLREYFRGERTQFTVPLHLSGTEFQRRAWQAMRKIGYGKTISYAQQARAIGAPRAVRAVGSANGRNPIPIIVPCHRVIASDGGLGGYALGLTMKRRLLAFESAA